MKQYLSLLRELTTHGDQKNDRTNTGTLSKFGHQMRFDLAKEFPLISTKRIHTPSVIHELLWMISGDDNIAYLKQNGITIWDEWADPETGSIGPAYGPCWRSWPRQNSDQHLKPTIDQLRNLVYDLRNNRDSRRMIVTAWNPDTIGLCNLPPCHCFFQAYVVNNKLSLQIYQRSCDVFLGLPFNLMSYGLLTMMLAQQCDMELGDLIWTGGDTHLYINHLEQAVLQLERDIPIEKPMVKIKKAESLFDYKFEDFEIVNYHPHPSIKAPVAV